MTSVKNATPSMMESEVSLMKSWHTSIFQVSKPPVLTSMTKIQIQISGYVGTLLPMKFKRQQQSQDPLLCHVHGGLTPHMARGPPRPIHWKLRCVEEGVRQQLPRLRRLPRDQVRASHVQAEGRRDFAILQPPFLRLCETPSTVATGSPV